MVPRRQPRQRHPAGVNERRDALVSAGAEPLARRLDDAAPSGWVARGLLAPAVTTPGGRYRSGGATSSANYGSRATGRPS